MALKSKCLILSAHDGLIDRRIIAQANALALSGREVTLVSLPAEGRQALVPQIRIVMAEDAESPGTLQARTLRRFARRLPAPVKSGLRSLAWRLGAVPLRRFTGYFDALTPPDDYAVIHCHDLQTLPSGLQLRSRCAPAARVIYDSHELFPGQFPPGRRRNYWTSIEAGHIGHAHAVITVNESIADCLAQQYALARPLVLYNSCHLEVGEISTEAFERHFGLSGGLPPRACRVLFQGGFTREKNVESLVRAMELLGPDFQLFLLGGGPLEMQLRKLVRQSPCRNVHFGAWVAGEHLLGYVRHAHAGVIPYLDAGLPNNHYCTPNKLFEYLQAGVPICANDLPELRRFVKGEGLGGVYPLGTAAEIAAALADFAPRSRAGEFTPDAFARAREKYSWDRQVRRLLHLYETLGV